jgi:hypothetical protein
VGGIDLKRNWLALSLAALGLIAGCAGGGDVRSVNDPGNSLVFGYIDMAEAPTAISGASIMQVAPASNEPYWGADARNGLFYTYDLPPGSYQLASVSGSDLRKVNYEYDLPQPDSGQARITQPGIYFLGSYRYVNTGDAGGFEVERMDTPTEAQLLQRILDEDRTVKGSAWEARIRERLSQLRSAPPRGDPGVLLARVPGGRESGRAGGR